MKFIRDLLTEDDAGETYCPVRVFGAAGMAMFHLFQGYAVFAHGAFDAMAYGTGFAAITAALGGAIGMKSRLGADHA